MYQEIFKDFVFPLLPFFLRICPKKIIKGYGEHKDLSTKMFITGLFRIVE